jgi:hypothetical protein
MTGWLQEWGDAGWELDREGKLLEHEFEARDVGHFVPRPDGATPRDFLSSSKLWTKKPDYWFWRWPAVNGDYSRLPGLTRRIYGENYRRAGSME